ncbi:uncharacterized protein LOC131804796 [Musca domestica]|uniref:Uncharacterized protein LOC131804796 n=1 Tax=Musca domestica TaxID=7370 RepID=A0ABM3VDV9_MUSDO|nr:uncharacterized protein LOC131804796 [Musca domestica]
MVNLPFKSLLKSNSYPILNNNVTNAVRRLKQIEISFTKRPSFSDTYKAFMQEYESLGHMTKIGTYPTDVRPNSYFLPHHGVFKESSSTTKLRVVFDGSSHLADYKSLNEELSPGPPLQNDLPGIMTKWRRHKIAFSADIEKMFRQIQWNTETDSFSFKVNLEEKPYFSKREILSESARLYDPLGWLTPTTVVAKSIFKQLWEHGVDWDEKIPKQLESQWLNHRSSLPIFSKLSIPRWIEWLPNCETQLHCFCDASTTAYAAVVYSRVITPNGIFVNILQAKSKVSPIKTVSIPRLELCAATLGVKLTQTVKDSLSDLNVQNIYYWSDSSTVLSWIRKSPSNWTVYVANRVADIQRLSNPIQWKYVPTSLNPADCASRGILAEELIEKHSWWFGPQFLYETEQSWPEILPNLHTSEEERKSKISTNLSTEKIYIELFSKYSKLQTLVRVVSYCLRFLENCRNPKCKKLKPLTLTEYNKSLSVLAKISQKVDFPEEISKLTTKRDIKTSPILKLMPFLDENGILRVGGRLQNSNFPYDVKHPIILSKHNPLSKLIISDAHEKTLHGGVTLTMSFVNRKFWIVSGNQLAKRIIHTCIKCFRYNSKTAQQIMGNLPKVRLTISRPFKHSGVDYAGPISIKNSNLRSSSITKGYICVFVCMVTKAIHLEAVSNLTTNAFLAAFKRFTSRRGICTDLYSDCGTNFVGASKELKVLHNKNKNSIPEDLIHSLSQNSTTWHFIPPASPNFGGLWEAGVKSVKYHLKRITNDRNLTFEELTTLLCQIESCLNSRPLCPLSNDPSDFEALTPAHFLIGEPTNCLQEETLLDSNINNLTRWKTIEKIKQHFWKRWQNEYLNRLQARPKWLKTSTDPKIGDLVLVTDERCGPGQWILGRIENTHPGPDGHTRVVSVLMKNKLVKRPISKICLLPDNSPHSDPDMDNPKTLL